MNRVQTGELLLMIRGIWQEQSIGDETLSVWARLMEPIEARAAREAVMQRAKSGMRRPSGAEVYREAVVVREKELERRRDRTRRLMAPLPGIEERDRVRRMIQATIEHIRGGHRS